MLIYPPMKSLNYSRYDWLIRLIVLPLYIGLLNWIMIGDTYWHNWTTLGLATGITFVESFANWLINNQIAHYINKTYNGVGLSNILTKYQMLDQPAPLIEDDGSEFRVTLPLV